MLALNITPATSEAVVLCKETLITSDLQVGMNFRSIT
jgi:hypothetical protein